MGRGIWENRKGNVERWDEKMGRRDEEYGKMASGMWEDGKGMWEEEYGRIERGMWKDGLRKVGNVGKWKGNVNCGR